MTKRRLLRLVLLAALGVCAPAAPAQNAELDALGAQIPELARAGDWPRLERLARDALALVERDFGAQSREAVTVLHLLAAALQRQGRLDEAQEIAQRGLELARRHFGATGEATVTFMENLAVLAAARNDAAAAERWVRAAIDAMEKSAGPSHPDLAPRLGFLANLLASAGRADEAVQLNLRMFRIYQSALGDFHPQTAEAFQDLIERQRRSGMGEEAARLVAARLAEAERAFGPRHVQALRVRLLHTVALREPAQAERELASAIGALEEAGESGARFLGPALEQLTSRLQQQGRFEEAERSARRALALAEQQGASGVVLASRLRTLAGVLSRLPRYVEAAQALERALRLEEAAFGPGHARLLTTLHALQEIHIQLDQRGRALEIAQRRAEIARKAFPPSHPTPAATIAELALLYIGEGEFARAERLLEDALAAAGADAAPEARDALRRTLAIAHMNQGRPARAESLLREIADAQEGRRGTESHSLAQTQYFLARLLLGQGRSAEAAKLLEKSISLMERELGADHPLTLEAQASLGVVLVQEGAEDAGEALLRRVADSYTRLLGEHRLTAHALLMLSVALIARDRLEAAVQVLGRTLAIQQKTLSPEHPHLAQTLEHLAWSLSQTGKHDEALPLARRAVALSERALGEDHPETARRYLLLGIAAERSRDLQGSVEAMRRGVATLRAARAGEQPSAERVRMLRDRLIYAAGVFVERDLQTGGTALSAEAFETAQLALATDTSSAVAKMASRFAAGDGELARLAREQQDAARDLAAAEAKVLAGDAAAGALVARHKAQLRRGEILLRELYPQYADLVRPQPLTVTQAQALLAPDEALLAWLFAANESYLFALTRSDFRAYILPLKLDTLRATVAKLRAALDPDRGLGRPFPADEARALYRLLVGPAEELLRDVRHVFAVPDDVLSSLPLSVLLTSDELLDAPGAAGDAAPDAGKRRGLNPFGREIRVADSAQLRRLPWLMRRWAVSMLPSVSSLHALRRVAQKSAASRPFLGVGDPVFDDHPVRGGKRGAPRKSASLRAAGAFRGTLGDPGELRKLPSLPETADELRSMAATLGASDALLVLRETARERNVRRLAFGEYRVVAFATHGLVSGELRGVTEPALVLTPPEQPDAEDDGLLTASEIAQLSLDADWVILSACNTAADDGSPGAEGLSGLAKAFLYAGARALLVSQWSVPSEPTVLLTTGMLRHARGGLRRAEAHRQAMLDFVRSPRSARLAHPVFWAPFVVVGEGGTPMR